MVIKIEQIKSGLKSKFAVQMNKEFKYYAYSYGIKNINNFYITNIAGEVVLTSDNINNVLSEDNKRSNIFNNEKQKVAEYYFESGIKFFIEYNNEEIKGYYRNEDYNTCISFYKDDVQVAEIVKSKTTFNNSDKYFIFILDRYNYLGEILSLFTIYYDYYYYNTASSELKSYSNSVSFELANKECLNNLEWVKENFNINEYMTIDKVSKVQYQKALLEFKETMIFLALIGFFVFGTMLLIKVCSK